MAGGLALVKRQRKYQYMPHVAHLRRVAVLCTLPGSCFRGVDCGALEVSACQLPVQPVPIPISSSQFQFQFQFQIPIPTLQLQPGSAQSSFRFYGGYPRHLEAGTATPTF